MGSIITILSFRSRAASYILRGIMLHHDIRQRLFQGHLKLLPQMNEIYELELAFGETQTLDDRGLIERSAYFASVDGVPTRHFQICDGDPLHLPAGTAQKRRQFFERNQFRTGYATHGLFPYRGKFHPQMVKGILNVLGIRPGELVLDPMMGSGTTLVEAALMGIESVGFDISPFCRFMTAAKLDGFHVPIEPLKEILNSSANLFRFFKDMSSGAVRIGDSSTDNKPLETPHEFPDTWFQPEVWRVLLLAYLDSVGFAERSSRQTPEVQFHGILERYAFVVEKLQRAVTDIGIAVGSAVANTGDARALPLGDSSVDGILFSPPYSFAVDYIENDAPHLRLMGVNLSELRDQMVGLRGSTLARKFDHYTADMVRILSECGRTLRSGRRCAIVVGTNCNQLAKLFGKSPCDVEGLDELMIRISEGAGLSFIRRFERRIVGMGNTMRNEDILLFQKK